MAGTILKGITWGHSRGITPLLAVSQRFSELYPGVEIQWRKRSLQEFADFPIEKLTRDFDLLIIDHPFAGCAAATGCLLPLDEFLPAEYMNDQLQHSVGYSHLSYQYDNKQWALAIDAATPAASFRKDLLEKNKVGIPRTWDDILELAESGRLALPAIPIDTLMNFYTFCIANGAQPFSGIEEVIDQQTGIAAINSMKALYSRIDRKMFNCNPIAVAELMSNTDEYWYCPFAYCYSNYSRKGYAKNLLHYTDVVSFRGKPFQTTIGGTGLAVSAFSQHRHTAIRFAEMIVSGECQRTMYVEHGGQPGHRSAWEDDSVNQLTNDFFKNILPVMDNGYVRPRYNGYLHFQDHAGEPLQQCLLHDGDPVETLNIMNQIYRSSFVKAEAV